MATTSSRQSPSRRPAALPAASPIWASKPVTCWRANSNSTSTARRRSSSRPVYCGPQRQGRRQVIQSAWDLYRQQNQAAGHASAINPTTNWRQAGRFVLDQGLADGQSGPPACCCGNLVERCAERFEKSQCRAVSSSISCTHRSACPLFRCGEPSTSVSCSRPARWPRSRPAGRRSSSRRSAWWRKTSRCCARSTSNGRGRISMSCRAASGWSRSRGSKTARIACCRKRSAAADEMPLTEVDALIRHAKEAPVEQVPAFRKILRATRLPLPLRRLFWLVGLNFGRQRANYFGSFGVTSVAAYGRRRASRAQPGAVYPQLWRGGAGPDHRRRDPLGSPDYRRRPDRQGPDPAGTGAEHRDRSRIARPKAADGAETGPGGRDLTVSCSASTSGTGLLI